MPVIQSRAAAEEGYATRLIPREHLRAFWTAAMRKDHHEERAATLRRILSAVEDDPIAYEAVRHFLVRALNDLGAVEEIHRLLQSTPVANTRYGADVYVESARAYVNAGVRLDEARELLARGFGILSAYERLEPPTESGVPRYAWSRSLENARIRLLTVLGRLEGSTGNLKQATRVFAEIFEWQDAPWGRIAFAETLEEAEEPTLAAEQYGLALARSAEDDADILAALERLKAHADIETILDRAREDRPHASRIFPLQLRYGAEPPALQADRLDGKPFDLGSYSGHEVLLLTFFESHCGPCIAEQPVLQRVRESFPNRDVHVVVIGLEPERSFREFVADKGRPGFVYAAVPEASIPTVRTAFSIEGFPVLLVIDHDRRIAYRHGGYSTATESLLMSQVDALLHADAP